MLAIKIIFIMTNEAIAQEWQDHRKRNADLYVEEIAQAQRVAKMFTDTTDVYQLHVGEVSESFADKVQFFLPEGWTVRNTDPVRGWNNHLLLTIPSSNETNN